MKLVKLGGSRGPAFTVDAEQLVLYTPALIASVYFYFIFSQTTPGVTADNLVTNSDRCTFIKTKSVKIKRNAHKEGGQRLSTYIFALVGHSIHSLNIFRPAGFGKAEVGSYIRR